MSARDDYQIVFTDPTYKGRAEVERALDEINRLRRWKAEASDVLGGLEAEWRSVGKPGELGETMAGGMAGEISRLRAEIARLGTLAGQLATSSDWWENAAVELASTLLDEGYKIDLTEQVMARHTADPADDDGDDA